MEDLNSVLVQSLLGLLGTFLTWFLIWLRKVIQEKVSNEYLQGCLERLTQAVETAVREAAQTTVPLIKEAAADGKISPEERIRIKERVREAAIDQLTKVDRQRLNELFDKDQLERKLDRQIEEVVQRLKEQHV